MAVAMRHLGTLLTVALYVAACLIMYEITGCRYIMKGLFGCD